MLINHIIRNNPFTRLICFVFCLIVLICPLYAIAEDVMQEDKSTDEVIYNYSLEDNIPQEIQSEVINKLLADSTGILGVQNRKMTVNRILEKYLKIYGIFAGINDKNDIVAWTQEKLTETGRIQYIPEAYVSDNDLVDYITRFAEKGDLLLYKTNGYPDRCLVYVGDGKALIKRDEVIKALPFPATYAKGDYNRTKSSGLFAFAHIWKIKETEKIEIKFKLKHDCIGFDGEQYQILERNPDGIYELSKKFILFEFTPGIYTIWDGTSASVSKEYLKEINGLHLQLQKTTHRVEGELPYRIKIDLSPEDIVGKDEVVIDIEENRNNLDIWDGESLVKKIRESIIKK